MTRILSAFFIAFLLPGMLPGFLSAQQLSKPAVPSAVTTSSSSFIQNQGQWSSDVLFMAQVRGMSVWLTKKGLMYDVHLLSPGVSLGRKTLGRRGQVIAMELVNANHGITAIGTEQQSGIRNYFIGDNPGKWRTNVPSFEKVITRDVYRGIDAVYTMQDGKPRYDFIIHPGGNPEDITLRFDGADAVNVSKKNGVELSTVVGNVMNGNIYAYQVMNGKEVPVQCSFEQHGDVVKFAVETYDRERQLIIDPLVYSTYFGGSEMDEVTAIKIDTAGNIVIAGVTDSPNFPIALGSYDTTTNGLTDAFVAKFDKSLSKAAFITYLGGGSDDKANALAIDVVSSSIFIAGETASSNIPTTAGSWKPSYIGGLDAFVARLSSNGSVLQYCTYVGGTKDDRALGICLDVAGKATICGETNSTNFPTNGASTYQLANGGKFDGFVTRLRPTGIGIDFSTYLGGAGDDRINAIECDQGGTVICFGGETNGGLQKTYPAGFSAIYCYNSKFNNGDSYDGFVGKMSGAGTFADFGKHFLTYIGDANNDKVLAVALLSAGDVVVAGVTEGGSGNKGFPASSGSNQSNGGTDCFISKLNPSGNTLSTSYMFGGSGNESLAGLAFSTTTGEFFVGGTTSSQNFPLPMGNGLPTPEKSNLDGTADGFVCRLPGNLTGLTYATYFGGLGIDGVNTVTATPRGDVMFAGYTASTDFTVQPDSYQKNNAGRRDGFVSKIAYGSVILSAPNGPVSYCPGSTVSIVWIKSEGLLTNENVDIELSADGGITWTTIAPNLSGTSYSWKMPANLPAGNAYKLRVQHTPSGIRDQSQVAFTLRALPEITTQPQNDSVCVGTRAVMRVKSTGTNLLYRWFVNDIEIKDEMRDSLVIPIAQANNRGKYRVEVNSGCQPVMSREAMLVVKPRPEITEEPKSGVAVIGKPFSFKVTATGRNLTYEWQQDGQKIFNANAPEYVITSVNSGNTGRYRVIVRGECGADTSITAEMFPNDVEEIPESHDEFSLVPNPAHDKVYLTCGLGVIHLTMFNSLGIQVREQTIEGGKGEIDVSGLISGVYVVQLRLGNRIITKQVVVL